MFGLGIGLGSGLRLRIGLGMGLGIGLGSGFEYFRQYNVIRRIGIRRNGAEPSNSLGNSRHSILHYRYYKTVSTAQPAYLHSVLKQYAPCRF